MPRSTSCVTRDYQTICKVFAEEVTNVKMEEYFDEYGNEERRRIICIDYE